MALAPCDSARPARNTATASATALAALTLLLAIVAGAFGMWQLRTAVTLERRAMALIGLRATTLRLQLDAATNVDQYVATPRPALARRYADTERELTRSLTALLEATRSMSVRNGPAIVMVMQRLHLAWYAAIAEPLFGDRRAALDAKRRVVRGRLIVDAFRHQSDRLVFAIQARVRHDNDAAESLLLRISMLLGSAAVLCGASVALVARRQFAVVRAETLLRERDILVEQSRAFQRAILPPRLPTVAGCAFDAIYKAGANDARIGGDWYDAVRLLDGRILISIGDVAGSGLEAAVVMGTVRQIMRGIAQVYANPALMLDAADRALQLEYADILVTAWVGVIDLVTQTLTYASAGHPPPLIADADETRELTETALPLGLRAGYQATASTVALNDGTMLVLYTDGLSEATHDVVAGVERVRAAAQRVAAAPGPHPAAAIANDVLWNGANDDVAILVVRVNFAEVEQRIERQTLRIDDAAAVRSARGAFIALLADRKFTASERFNSELVFGELIANVVRHGVGSATIEIVVDCSGPQIVLHVLDRGPGFRHNSRLPADIYAETGRGLFLIAALTDDFSVSERPAGGSHARAVFVSRSFRPLESNRAVLEALGRA